MEITGFTSLFDLLLKFPNEQACIDHLELKRWNGNVVSPFDAKSKVYKCKAGRYKCKNTGKYFNVRTGTMYEDSKVPLQKWFFASFMLAAHKKGISSHQLARDLKVTQKTAWFMLHRIRNTFSNPNLKAQMGDVVQCDETFVGGKNKNRHADKKIKYKQLQDIDKQFPDKVPVLGMISDGKVQAYVITAARQEFTHPHIFREVKAGSMLVTDEWHGYKNMKDHYSHEVVTHYAHQYVNENGFTTNSIEGFWTTVKRSIYGIYHTTSKHLLQRYIDEAVFRFNTRELTDGERFGISLGTIEKRLKYKDLIAIKPKTDYFSSLFSNE